MVKLNVCRQSVNVDDIKTIVKVYNDRVCEWFSTDPRVNDPVLVSIITRLWAMSSLPSRAKTLANRGHNYSDLQNFKEQCSYCFTFKMLIKCTTNSNNTCV